MLAFLVYWRTMKIVEQLSEFPKKIALRGLQLEAFQALQNMDKSKPVIKIAPDGQNVAAIKRAFAAAAKVLGGSVETRNGEDGTILAKWSPTPSTRGRKGAGASKARVAHSDAAVTAEMERLWKTKGSTGILAGQSAEVKRKLTISAKRNLSRAAR